MKTILISGPGINTLDLSILPAGSYICHFRNENATKSYIVVKR